MSTSTPDPGSTPFDSGQYRTWTVPTESNPPDTSGGEIIKAVAEPIEAAETAAKVVEVVEGPTLTGAEVLTAFAPGPVAVATIVGEVLFGAEAPGHAEVGICIDPSKDPDLQQSSADGSSDSYPGQARYYPNGTGGVSQWPGGPHTDNPSGDTGDEPDQPAQPDPSSITASSASTGDGADAMPGPSGTSTGAGSQTSENADDSSAVCLNPDITADATGAGSESDQTPDAGTDTDASGGGSTFDTDTGLTNET